MYCPYVVMRVICGYQPRIQDLAKGGGGGGFTGGAAH